MADFLCYTKDMNKTFALTVNGQSLQIVVNEIGDATQVTSYYARRSVDYRAIGSIGYGGYESGRIHQCSTRTIANMVERHIKNQGWTF